jgi:hypothetical protein
MIALVGLGGLLLFIGAIWLVVVAIQTGNSTGEKVVWALVNFLCNPIGGIVFYVMRKQGLVPMLISIAGFVLYMIGAMMGGADIMQQLPR